jgi:hypothetical protein
MVNKIESGFRGKLETAPLDEVRLIVRVKGDMSAATVRLAELGVTVLRSFRLIHAVAVRCSAQQALALLMEPCVEAIEEDRQVSVQ